MIKNKLSDIEYKKWFADIKLKIQLTQIKAAIKVNTELLQLYWELGSQIVEKQKQSKWGDKLIEQLSKDLKKEFPKIKGFSKSNIKYMKQWYLFYSHKEISQQLVDQLSKIIIQPIKSQQLVDQIEKQSVTQKEQQLVARIINLICQIPWGHNMESALLDNLTKFLLELGVGFSFLGRQYHFEVEDDDFYIDLLFYHVKLHCYVVVELKTTKFKPEYAGKLNFYLSAVDDKLKSDIDQPSIGILICKDKNKTVAEYALRDIKKPIGVSEYKLTESLPKKFKSSLPSIKEIENEIEEIKVK